jgi:hypothetical protein
MNQIPVLDEWVTVLSLLGSSASLVMNWRAARVGLITFRTVHAAIAAISVMYVAGYLWLLFGNVDPVRWSSTLRGISLVSWVVVWVMPAAMSVQINRKMHAAIRKRFGEDRGES